MLGPYRYDCPVCQITSPPYLFRYQAEKVGHDHRHRCHDGMHPASESIKAPEFRAPKGGERTAILVFFLVVVAAFASHLH